MEKKWIPDKLQIWNKIQKYLINVYIVKDLLCLRLDKANIRYNA